MTVNGPSAAVLMGALALGCAFDSRSDSSSAWAPPATDGSSDGTTDDAATGAASSGDAACEQPCNQPPSDCFLEGGECVDGTCVYVPAPAGVLCNDDCEHGGICETTGVCICKEDPGTDCEETCTAGPNATASCTETGACEIACVEPWQDCDGDMTNGCEVPVGVPHQCDANGLNPDGGCWTAYCGPGGDEGTVDFGTYHCVDCPTCRQPGDGQCQWCNHDTGNFYPAAECSCETDLDAACSP